MASQNSTRKSFIDSSIQLVRNYSFHGLDLDWEYPSSATKMTNLCSLLTEWRSVIAKESNSTGKTALLLYGAFFYNSNYYMVTYPFQAISNRMDWVNLMTYDFYGPCWSPNVIDRLLLCTIQQAKRAAIPASELGFKQAWQPIN